MSISKSLRHERFVVETNVSGVSLKAVTKRYTWAFSRRDKPQSPATILLFAHGISLHSELWEPTIERLFHLDGQDAESIFGPGHIQEAWTIDAHNHGESALLNEQVLLQHPGIWTAYDYGNAFASLCTSGPLGDAVQSNAKVVLVAHSAGAVAAVLATSFFNPPNSIVFDSLILVEPTIFSHATVGRETKMYKALFEFTTARSDVWSSRETARRYLEGHPSWNKWDPRVLSLYVDHGLRSLPTAIYPDKDGVTLTCAKGIEARCYKDNLKYAFHALHRLSQICETVPVHVIFGARSDLFTRETKESIISPTEGRKLASVTRIPGVGHSIVQETPDRLADTLFAILGGAAHHPVTSSRL